MLESLLPLIFSALGGGGFVAFLNFLINRRKVVNEGIELFLQQVKDDNDRLRAAEVKMQNEIDQLKNEVHGMRLKLQLMESAHQDLPLPQWLKDLNGTMLSINTPYERVFGKSREEYVGSNDVEVWGEKVGKQFQAHDRKVHRLRKPIHVLEKVPMPDGEVEVWEIYKYPRFAGKTLIGIGGIAFKQTDQ